MSQTPQTLSSFGNVTHARSHIIHPLWRFVLAYVFSILPTLLLLNSDLGKRDPLPTTDFWDRTKGAENPSVVQSVEGNDLR